MILTALQLGIDLLALRGSYKLDIKKMSFHTTNFKQENCDLEVIQVPQYQHLCSTSSCLYL